MKHENRNEILQKRPKKGGERKKAKKKPKKKYQGRDSAVLRKRHGDASRVENDTCPQKSVVRVAFCLEHLQEKK